MQGQVIAMWHGLRSVVMVSALAVASCSVLPPGKVAAPKTSPQPNPETGTLRQGKARLIFERSSENRATACPALIYVDGTLRARLGAAQSATIPVRAGYLNVRVKLGKFCGTISDRIFALKAAPGAEYRYRVGIADEVDN